MNFTADRDAKIGDKFLDISKTEKRLFRVTSKTYEKTGTYFFLKVFKKTDCSDFIIQQRLSLTSSEFENFLCKAEEIQALKKQQDGGGNV